MIDLELQCSSGITHTHASEFDRACQDFEVALADGRACQDSPELAARIASLLVDLCQSRGDVAGSRSAAGIASYYGAQPHRASPPAPHPKQVLGLLMAVRQCDEDVDLVDGTWLSVRAALDHAGAEYLDAEGMHALGLAVQIACEIGTAMGMALLSLVLQSGVPADARLSNGQTALMKAAHCARPDLCQLLLDAHGNPSITDAEGFSALHTACLGQHSNMEALPGGDLALVVALLLKHGADVNGTTRSGMSPLLFCAQLHPAQHHLPLLLLRHGASVTHHVPLDQPCAPGYMALDFALASEVSSGLSPHPRLPPLSVGQDESTMCEREEAAASKSDSSGHGGHTSHDGRDGRDRHDGYDGRDQLSAAGVSALAAMLLKAARDLGGDAGVTAWQSVVIRRYRLAWDQMLGPAYDRALGLGVGVSEAAGACLQERARAEAVACWVTGVDAVGEHDFVIRGQTSNPHAILWEAVVARLPRLLLQHFDEASFLRELAILGGQHAAGTVHSLASSSTEEGACHGGGAWHGDAASRGLGRSAFDDFLTCVQIPLQHTFSCAIPNESALSTLAELGPVLELGAGSGYWGGLLEARGVEVLLFDIEPPTPDGRNEFFGSVFANVQRGGAERASAYPGHTLLLVWPYSPQEDSRTRLAQQQPWDVESLLAYYKCGGGVVAHVGDMEQGGLGEGAQPAVGVMTTSPEFCAELRARFDLVRTVAIPNWPHLRDELTIWRRRHAPQA